MKKKSLLAIIGAVAVLNLVSRLIGFVREMVVSYHFGTSFLADSVTVAYTIPNFLYIVAGGAITTAFISVYSKIDGESTKRQLANVIFTYTFLIMGIISLALLVFPAFWIELFFPGFGTEELAVTSRLFGIMGFSTVFLVLSMFFSGMLNTKGHFQLTAAAPLLNNLLYVMIALICFPILAEDSYAWGAVIGALSMIFLLLYQLKKTDGYKMQFVFKMKKPEYFFRFLKISIPILLGGATLQFYFLVHRIFASSLDNGYIAALNYASKLTQLPQAVLMSAVTTVIYPLLAKKVATKEYHSLQRLYNDGLSYMLYLMIPITVVIYYYSGDVVQIVFERGEFGQESSIITSGLLKVFVIGMFAHAANVYVTRFYYAMEKAMLPVVSGVLAVFGLNILIITLFMEEYGAMAIAWSTTISAYFQLAILIFAAPKVLNLKISMLWKYVKLLVLTIGLVLVAFLTKSYVQMSYAILDLGVGLVILTAAFMLLSLLMKISEWEKAADKIKKIFKK